MYFCILFSVIMQIEMSYNFRAKSQDVAGSMRIRNVSPSGRVQRRGINAKEDQTQYSYLPIE